MAPHGLILRIILGLAAVLAMVTGCVQDGIGPGSPPAAAFSMVPVLDNVGPSGLVPIAEIRLRLNRTRDSIPTVDTVVRVPDGATELDLSLTVPLLSRADTFLARMAMITPEGDTAFRGGPLPVIATPQNGDLAAPVPVPVYYVGIGSDASGIRISSPLVSGLFSGDTIVLSAVASTVDGADVSGTPIGWYSLDPALASVSDPSVGRIVAGSQRGTARIVAQTITGLADTVTLDVQLPPAIISVVSGALQTGEVASLLPSPLAAQLRASDNVGVSGVWVKFAVTAGNGSLSLDSVLTDAAGNAEVQWTLGTVTGVQRVEALAPRVQGSVVFSATALAGAAADLVVSALPTSLIAGELKDITVGVRDAYGNIVTHYTGTVSFSSNDTLASLPQSYTFLPADSGVHTFARAVALKTAGGRSVTVTDLSQTGVTSTVTAMVNPAAATTLAFTKQPVSTLLGLVLPPVEVTAFDPYGNVATGFTGDVTVTLLNNPLGALLGGTLTVPAVGGVTTFNDLTVSLLGTGYALGATATGLTTAVSATFDIL